MFTRCPVCSLTDQLARILLPTYEVIVIHINMTGSEKNVQSKEQTMLPSRWMAIAMREYWRILRGWRRKSSNSICVSFHCMQHDPGTCMNNGLSASSYSYTYLPYRLSPLEVLRPFSAGNSTSHPHLYVVLDVGRTVVCLWWSTIQILSCCGTERFQISPYWSLHSISVRDEHPRNQMELYESQWFGDYYLLWARSQLGLLSLLLLGTLQEIRKVL